MRNRKTSGTDVLCCRRRSATRRSSKRWVTVNRKSPFRKLSLLKTIQGKSNPTPELRVKRTLRFDLHSMKDTGRWSDISSQKIQKKYMYTAKPNFASDIDLHSCKTMLLYSSKFDPSLQIPIRIRFCHHSLHNCGGPPGMTIVYGAYPCNIKKIFKLP